MKNQWMIDGAEALSDKRVSKKDFFKNFYLKDCSFPDEGKLLGETELKDLKEMGETVVELLKELKKNAQYSNLADYYIALRYILGWGCGHFSGLYTASLSCWRKVTGLR